MFAAWQVAPRHPAEGALPELVLIVATPGAQAGELEAAHIRLSEAACRYGGVHTWLHCPECGRRVFRRYWSPDVVLGPGLAPKGSCRRCLVLTYAQKHQRGAGLDSFRAGGVLRKFDRWSQNHDEPVDPGAGSRHVFPD